MKIGFASFFLLAVLLLLSSTAFILRGDFISDRSRSHHHQFHGQVVTTSKSSFQITAKITPNAGQSLDEYRLSLMKLLDDQKTDSTKLGGRELLELLIKKWGVAYDIQLRKNTPFGEGSANIYINIMWRYFGQKSFPHKTEREYLEHLEAVARYITAVKRVKDFKEKVGESRKRPNAYFGYAVGIPLDVDPSTADEFFKDLPYE